MNQEQDQEQGASRRKRRLPLRKRLRRWFALTIVVGLLTFAADALLAYTAKPGDPAAIHAELEALIRAQHSSQDASEWPAFEQLLGDYAAIERAVLEEQPQEEDRLPYIDYAVASGTARWPDGDDPDAMDALTRLLAGRVLDRAEADGLLDRLDRLQADGLVRPLPTSPIVIALFEDAGRARMLVRFCGYRTRVMAERGQWAEAARSLGHTLVLGEIYTRQPIVLLHLVGCAVHAVAYQGILEMAGHEEAPASFFDETLRLLRQHEPWPIIPAIEGDRLTWLELIQLTHTDDGNGNGRFLPQQAGHLGGKPMHTLMNVAGRRFPRKKEVVEHVNAWFSSVAQAAAQPPYLADRSVPVPPPPRSAVGRSPAYQIDLLAPSMAKALRTHDFLTAHHAGAVTVCLIESYRRTRGELPASLDAAAAAAGLPLPTDPYSGQPLVYRPGEDGSYILYALGADCADDGGRPHPDSPHIAADPVKGAGYDFVLMPVP